MAPIVWPAANAAAGQPHRVAVDVMVAADQLARLAHRRAAELAAPDHERVFQQPALLEIGHQRRRRPVDFAAALVERLAQVRAGLP